MTSNAQERSGGTAGVRTARPGRPYACGRRSPRLFAAVAAAVVIAAGAGACSGGGTGGGAAGTGTPGAPPPQLTVGPAGGTPVPSPGSPTGSAPPGQERYRAAVPLPKGPSSAPVYQGGSDVSRARAAALAAALGLRATPVSDGSTWRVGDASGTSGPLLRIQKDAPGAWTFARGTSPSPGARAASARAALHAAAPVLKAAGQDDAKTDASRAVGPVRVVNADPVVGGMSTYGWDTGLEVASDGSVTGGSGHLVLPAAGDRYPTVSAGEALKRLNATPVMVMRPGADCTRTGPLTDAPSQDRSCPGTATPAGTPLRIDRAVFGLSEQTVNGRAALLPSWLFRVAAHSGVPAYTVAQPAVSGDYLKAPGTPSPPQASPPHVVRPGDPPKAGSPSPLAGSQLLSYTTQGRSLTVSFWGGICGGYTARASESDTAVRVRITPTGTPPGTECAALAKRLTRTVTLDRPVGDRAVLSDPSGTPIRKA